VTDPQPKANPAMQLNNDQMDELVARIIAQLAKAGINVSPSDTAAAIDADTILAEDQQKRAELKNLAIGTYSITLDKLYDSSN
jgi:uncharacterized protein with von Willebrand factor type A (vWA) domain